ncbi:MAG: Fic family protein [Bacillota bacterium]
MIFDMATKIQVPMRLIRAIAIINEYKGKQELYQNRSPEILKTLHEAAIIQSTESSNRIEGIKVSDQALKEIMSKNSTPKNSSEAEISGYRDVLATIHASALDIPLKPQTILQLYGDLYKYLPQEGGKWKASDNIIEEILPDGTIRVRFTPVTAFLVPDALEGLCSSYISLRSKGEVDELLHIFNFILDFLCIHPFNDGNGRKME